MKLQQEQACSILFTSGYKEKLNKSGDFSLPTIHGPYDVESCGYKVPVIPASVGQPGYSSWALDDFHL